MPKLIPLKQRTPEWHAWRKGKISASMIATIMGFNPKKTPLQLYEQLIKEEEEPVNPAMQRGINYEGEARKAFEKYLDKAYPEACIEHVDNPYFIASLDGYNSSQNAPTLEIKVMGKADHQQAKLGVVPSLYYPQVQWQIYCADAEKGWFASYYPEESDLEAFKVARDDKFIEKAREAAEWFKNCLIEMIPPEPTERDLFDLSEDVEAEEICTIIQKLDLSIKRQEAEKEILRRKLINKCEGKSCKIGDYRMVRYMRRGNVDYGNIPELIGIDLNKFRKKAIETWRFS